MSFGDGNAANRPFARLKWHAHGPLSMFEFGCIRFSMFNFGRFFNQAPETVALCPSSITVAISAMVLTF